VPVDQCQAVIAVTPETCGVVASLWPAPTPSRDDVWEIPQYFSMTLLASPRRHRQGKRVVMTDREPRPLWPLLTAALIGLPVLYVVIFAVPFWMVVYGLLNENGLSLCPPRFASANSIRYQGSHPMIGDSQPHSHERGIFCSGAASWY